MAKIGAMRCQKKKKKRKEKMKGPQQRSCRRRVDSVLPAEILQGDRRQRRVLNWLFGLCSISFPLDWNAAAGGGSRSVDRLRDVDVIRNSSALAGQGCGGVGCWGENAESSASPVIRR